MIPEAVTNDLKDGLSLEETLTKNNTNLKELFAPNKRHARGAYGKYYSPCSKGFRVRKRINGKQYSFGTYPTEEAAKLAVKLFMENGWNPEDNWRIRAEVRELTKIK